MIMADTGILILIPLHLNFHAIPRFITIRDVKTAQKAMYADIHSIVNGIFHPPNLIMPSIARYNKIHSLKT